MTDRDTNWKKHLLRSSVPLEHQVAAVLTRHGFHVPGAYSYMRSDEAVEKEFSVDVRGVLGLGSLEHAGRQMVFDLLVECKFRDRGAIWLFLPQPGGENAYLYPPLQAIDVFSPLYIHGSMADDESMRVCYAAIEVGGGAKQLADDRGKEKARESAIKHGLRQLQYAIPPLVALRVRSVARRPAADNHPFFFCQVLVTNATLLVANEPFGIVEVEQAATLHDLGTVVPYLTLVSELGPDFDEHARKHMKELNQLVKKNSMREVEELQRAAGTQESVLPSALAARISTDGSDFREVTEVTSLLVVNVEALDGVVEHLKAQFIKVAETARKEPVKWP